MKRLILILTLLFVTLSAYAGARNENGWTAVGVSWATQREKQGGIDYTAKMSSFCIDIDSYQFQNDSNWGFFMHAALGFPQRGTIESGGTGVSVRLRDYYDTLFGISETFGFGYKANINENTLFVFGIGPDLKMLIANNKYIGNFSFMLGIGGDIGLKVDLTDLIGIRVGSILAFDFASHTTIFLDDEKYSAWASKYRLFTLQPYICLSFSYNYDENGKRHWSKL